MKKNLFVAYVLLLFGGIFGLHRFYYGKQKSGALYLATMGLLGIGLLVDIFLLPFYNKNFNYPNGKYSYNKAWLLFTFFSIFGIHKFYLKQNIMGFLYLINSLVFFYLINEQSNAKGLDFANTALFYFTLAFGLITYVRDVMVMKDRILELNKN
jgi:TM2 domain-containing membrane protein YozV